MPASIIAMLDASGTGDSVMAVLASLSYQMLPIERVVSDEPTITEA